MIIIEILIAIYLLGSFIHFQVNKKRNSHKTALLAGHIDASETLKKTLAMGIYLRFREEKESYHPTIKENNTFLKQDPYAFESFVAAIIESAKGGSTWVSPSTGDNGVDFEHTIENEKFLGQVKCYKDNVDYEPIAILHSNMMKEQAKGGYVITTSSFTNDAKKYAKGLDIELIEGVDLVELWIAGLNTVEEEIKQLTPDFVK
ncbi:restriction endonuclease [Ornithinibacillus xuwenensis]|uniref:Restriction endonuclease n=1 Tax=Ornithinibacillus xuwenensis TaxID=3144668 RepID=A0ABU9XJ33_9BACI